MTVKKMEAQIVDKPAFTAVGMLVRAVAGDPRMMQLWMDFAGQTEKIQGQTNRGVFYGAIDNYDEASGQFDYLACVEVSEGQEPPESMVAWQIPAQTYAVFETTLPEIGATFETIYGPWLAKSEFVRTDGPEFELYDDQFNPEDPSSKMYVYIPVAAK